MNQDPTAVRHTLKDSYEMLSMRVDEGIDRVTAEEEIDEDNLSALNLLASVRDHLGKLVHGETGLHDSMGNPIHIGDTISWQTRNVEVHGHWADHKVIAKGMIPITQYVLSQRGLVLPPAYLSGKLADCYDQKRLCFEDIDELRPADTHIEVVPGWDVLSTWGEENVLYRCRRCTASTTHYKKNIAGLREHEEACWGIESRGEWPYADNKD